MTWKDPTLLFLLWVLPVAAWLLIAARSRRRRAIVSFAGESLAPRLAPRERRSRLWLRDGLWVAGFGLLLTAAARPAFGVYYAQVESRGADLVVCLDVSRSMLAADVAPNRLERARTDLLGLVERVEGHRLGLVLFAGTAITACPLTADRGFLRLALREAGTHSAPRGGSHIGDAIRAALETMEARADRDQAILLITDGEDQDSLPEDAAAAAAERGVRIFTVGLGDAGEGARIPLANEQGGTTYLQHEGQEVWSKLDRELLQAIALQTAGAYVDVGTRSYDLARVYEDHLEGLARGENEAEEQIQLRERYQWFAGAGLLLLCWRLLLARATGRPEALPREELA